MTMATILSIFSLCIALVTATPYGVDVQVKYLSSIMNKAKLHPMVNGEINFSPNGREFSNVVKSISGIKGNILPTPTHFYIVF